MILFAYFMLFIWPLVIIMMVNTSSLKNALLWAAVGSYLILPKLRIDPPFLPPLNKGTLTFLVLFVFLKLMGINLGLLRKSKLRNWMIVYFVILVISTELNKFPVYVGGGKTLKALSHYDAFSSIIRYFVWILPMLLGRRIFDSFQDNERIFRFFTTAGLLYSLLMLFEVRMSPQLHNWIYGYVPTIFGQQMRLGGFRPIVFVGHGLPLSFVFTTFMFAAFALYKNKVQYTRFRPLHIIIYMFVVLLLCKTVSSLVYAILGIFLMYRYKPEKQVKIATIFVLSFMLFPASRALDIFPATELVDFVYEYSEDRAQSLDFRFSNEDILLERAMERPYFGWAGWGRNRVYDEDTGRSITVTDGKWIIELGNTGAIGALVFFLILSLPILNAAKAIKLIPDERDKIYIAAHTIILTFSIVDSIPNTSLGTVQLFIAGCLYGQTEHFLNQIKNKRAYTFRTVDSSS